MERLWTELPNGILSFGIACMFASFGIGVPALYNHQDSLVWIALGLDLIGIIEFMTFAVLISEISWRGFKILAVGSQAAVFLILGYFIWYLPGL